MDKVSSEAGGATRDRIDARPIRPISADTLWDRALALRDQFAAQVRATLESERIQALVFVSSNGNYPPWVKLEAWLPRPEAQVGDERERAELLLVIEPKPYHRHQLVVSAQSVRGGRTIRVEQLTRFSGADVAEWTRYAVRRAGKPSNYRPFVNALRRLFVWRSNPVERTYRGWLPVTGTGLLALAAALLLLLAPATADGDAGLSLLLAVLGIAALIAAVVLARRRKHVVCVPEQSVLAPRNLGLVDSWYAVVAELGRDCEEVKARLIGSVMADQGTELIHYTETYGYRTPNGYEERERLVVCKDQAVVQVHIYRFGDDLFVGWHAYLNWAQWSETAPVSSKVESGQLVEFRALRQDFYVPNQFDLIDLDSLSELVHRRLQRELKAILKEKEIDQEIDFRIIHGDRDTALDKARHGDKGASRRGWRYVSMQPS